MGYGICRVQKVKAAAVGSSLPEGLRTLWKARNDGSREDTLGSDLEGLRSRISRPLEYLMRRKQPRQQSLDDVVRDAQRAADAWNRDHAAPQRTYRGRAR